MFKNEFIIKIIKQIIKFSIVGFFGVIINYSTFAICLIILDLHYLISGFFGYLVPAVPIFLINRYWTFDSNISVSKGIPIYILIDIAKISLHLMVQFGVAEFLGVPKIYSQGCGIITSTILGFILVRKLMNSKI